MAAQEQQDERVVGVGDVLGRRFGGGRRLALTARVVAAVELVSGSFDQLLTFAMFGIVSFSTLTVASVFVLRARRPDAPRPFRVPGYPVVPALFVAINAWVLWSVVQYAWGVAQHREHGSLEALVALAIVLAGFPAYAVFRSKNRVQESR